MWLAIVGGVILVVLVAYNAWTSRQNQPKQAEPLITPEELDAQLPGQLVARAVVGGVQLAAGERLAARVGRPERLVPGAGGVDDR